ncbi:glycosyltransferase [Bdellovibrio bacteriovorus]|uniref:Glycosyltransferase n=1 Tax=Bdellovibrio bacteriovorus TaxID=959 RepID=A0A150WK07_BDEBC|nr:glycosyltransferase family 4 protein [Bdellovibrio bacteriovorus]KYG64046.1 glycosyltransferase [Bdellovibrio bacteriovorus]
MGQVKVLHCLHSLSWGGLEIYSVELIEKLSELGIEQYVLCAGSSKAYEELKKKKNLTLLPFPEAKLSKLATARLIRRHVRQYGITHLHSHTRLDMWACALARWNWPQIKHFYNLYMNATPKKDFIHRWLFSKVDALCSSSENILHDVRKNFPIAKEKLKLIRYGRKTEDFVHNEALREKLRIQYGVKKEQIVIGSLCRIDPGKGVRELVSALDYLNDQELAQVQLWIVGDPTTIGKNSDGSPIYEPPSAELNAWVSEKTKSPRLMDHIRRISFQRDYVSYIDALDVFTLASYNETYSLSVIDAMLMGKPVVGTNAGGTPEQVGANERGLLAEPKDAESLALAFRHYLKHPADRAAQGKKAQEWAFKNHSWQEVLKQYQALYFKE